MKWPLRIFAALFLLTTALLTVSRRQNSGWIAFTAFGDARPERLLMTGDGSSQTKPANLDAILQHDDPQASFLRVVRDDAGEAIHILAANGSGSQRVPLDPSLRYLSDAVWSPDREWIAFLSGDVGGEYIYRIRPDGSDLQRLTRHASDLIGLQWSPDGEWLLVMRAHQRYADIMRVRADDSSLEVLAPGTYPEYAPVSGLAWRPLWGTIASLMLLVASMFGRPHS